MKKRKKPEKNSFSALLRIKTKIFAILLLILIVLLAHHSFMRVNMLERACKLYAEDIRIKRFSTPPHYPCILSCPETNILGYCPEEMYMKILLYRKVKELLKTEELNADVNRDVERVHSSIDNLYILLLTENNTAEKFQRGVLATKYFLIEYNGPYVVLRKFIETKDPKVLDTLYEKLVMRSSK